MSYTKTNWENSPSTNTPVNASNLNKIENKLVDLDTRVTTVENRPHITQLLNATSLTEKEEYTLSDDITNYKYIMIELSTATQHQNANRQYIPISMLTGYSANDRCAITIYQSASVYVFADFYFSASNKIYCYTYQKSSWTGFVKVYGIN